MVKTYKVGGSVRDQLLRLPPTDNDYVVVGADSEYMLSQGFIKVGKDFPVYLHPNTHEEYALARLERKAGVGHKAFTFDTQKSVTLVDDLKRRDITINAMALDDANQLIDPFNGLNDLKAGIIRHVSSSFSEDPLRVLRVARFSARFNFVIAPETLQLMQDIVKSRELLSLSKERIIEEVAKALENKHIEIFFSTLISIGALTQILPGLSKNSKVAHTEFIRALAYLNNSNLNKEEKFAILGFYSDNLDFFSKKSSRHSRILIKTLTQINDLSSLCGPEVLALINIIDPIRQIDAYISLKKILLVLGQIKDLKNIAPNLQIIDTIIQNIKAIDYTTLKESPNFIAKISEKKLEIINNILAKTQKTV